MDGSGTRAPRRFRTSYASGLDASLFLWLDDSTYSSVQDVVDSLFAEVQVIEAAVVPSTDDDGAEHDDTYVGYVDTNGKEMTAMVYHADDVAKYVVIIDNDEHLRAAMYGDAEIPSGIDVNP